MKYNKLPVEFKKKWVEALRSGKYKQGSGELYDNVNNRYCCLGVACRISGVRKSSLIGMGLIDEDFSTVPELIKGSSYISTALSSMNDGVYPEGDSKNATPRLNFLEIADWIEENL